MKKLIEDIYDNYYLDKTADNSVKRRKALHLVVEKQKELKSKLGEKEKELLEEYDEARTNLEWESNKEIFVDGVTFGAEFILEILNTKYNVSDISDT